MKLGELFVELGIVGDTKSLKEFEGTLSNVSVEAIRTAAELAGVSYGIAQLTKEAFNAAVGFDMFAATTGQSWEELQKWQIVGEQVNVTAEEITSSVTALTQQMAQLRLGKGNLYPWQMLGIDPTNRNPFAVLDQLRDKIKGLDRPTAINLMTQLGLTPQMIKILELSNEEFSKLSKTTRGMTAEQEQNFLKAKQALVQYGQTLKYFGFDVISHLVEGFDMLWDAISRVRMALPLLGAAAAALAVYFAPVTAAVLGLLLLLDDLAVYAMGGKSVIGLIVDLFKNMGQANNGASGPPLASMFGTMNPLAMFGSMPAWISQFSNAAAAGNRTVNQTINVTAGGLTGGAAELGKMIADEIMRQFRQADNETNNQGH